MKVLTIKPQNLRLMNQRLDKVLTEGPLIALPQHLWCFGAYEQPQSTFFVDDTLFKQKAHAFMHGYRVDAIKAHQLAVGRYLLIGLKLSQKNVVLDGFLDLQEKGAIIV
jgi:hypothetical protein